MQALFFADERGAKMSKYDEFDLDIRKNADTVNDAGDARSGLECATWSICVDLTISVVLSQCCTDGCTDACTTPSQGCTGTCDQTLSACHSYCGNACRR